MGYEPLGPIDSYTDFQGKTLKKISSHRGKFLLLFKNNLVLELSAEDENFVDWNILEINDLDTEQLYYLDLVSHKEYLEAHRKNIKEYEEKTEKEEKEHMYQLMEKYNVQSSSLH